MILRRAGLAEFIQREYRIVLSGPSTLAALLNSFQMGFRTLAIQKRSSEVWTLLGAVKTEFGKFGEVIDKVQKKLQEANIDAGNSATNVTVADPALPPGGPWMPQPILFIAVSSIRVWCAKLLEQ